MFWHKLRLLSQIIVMLVRKSLYYNLLIFVKELDLYIENN